jgi:hypothetical protein
MIAIFSPLRTVGTSNVLEGFMRIIATFTVAEILLLASSSQAQASDEKVLRRIEAETARVGTTERYLSCEIPCR